MAGFLTAVAYLILDLVLTIKDSLTVPPYQKIIEPFALTPESSDESIEEAILAMNHLSSENKRCESGWVHAVTRNGKRIIVPDGVLEIGKAKTPVTQDTLFEIGSVSKPITGLVLAQKVTAGLVTLDTPLNDLLPDSIPDLIVNGELVTLGQLVTHTAGIPLLSIDSSQLYRIYKALPNRYKRNPYGGYTEEDLLREIGDAAGRLDQSGEFEYSNFGFMILAYLLGRSENTSFPALQKALTDQLGMNNTWIGTLPDEARIHLSTGYRDSIQVPHWFDGGILIDGAGSTLSSARDLCQYLEALMSPNTTIGGDGDLVNALKLSLTPLTEISPESNFPYSGLAFAWWFNVGADNATQSENVVYRHTGGTGGYATSVLFQPSSQTGIISMASCKRGGGDIARMQRLLVQRLLVGQENARFDLMPEEAFFQSFALLN